MQPIQQLSEFETDMPVQEVTNRLRVLLEARGGSVEATPAGLQARGGSRLARAMWGVYLKAGRSRLPWRASIGVQAGQVAPTAVKVFASSDEGWMAARVPKLTTEYEALLADIVSSVSAAVMAE